MIKTKTDFYNAVSALGYPAAYIRFSKRQVPPFIVYAFPDDVDTYADNEHYFKVMGGWLELYSAGAPDFIGQEKIEQMFRDNGIPYSKKNEDFIESESLFYCRWEFELIGG